MWVVSLGGIYKLPVQLYAPIHLYAPICPNAPAHLYAPIPSYICMFSPYVMGTSGASINPMSWGHLQA